MRGHFCLIYLVLIFQGLVFFLQVCASVNPSLGHPYLPATIIPIGLQDPSSAVTKSASQLAWNVVSSYAGPFFGLLGWKVSNVDLIFIRVHLILLVQKHAMLRFAGFIRNVCILKLPIFYSVYVAVSMITSGYVYRLVFWCHWLATAWTVKAPIPSPSVHSISEASPGLWFH